MVNKNKGGVYNPTPIYNRKMLRNIIRNRALEVKGRHNVSAYVREAFKEVRDNINKEEA